MNNQTKPKTDDEILTVINALETNRWDEKAQKANALLSAAPELLEALKATLNIISQNRTLGLNQGSEYVSILKKAENAIAKAEGLDSLNLCFPEKKV